MTTLIQQLNGNDCALAAIAMAVGKSAWHELWTNEDSMVIDCIVVIATHQGITNDPTT